MIEVLYYMYKTEKNQVEKEQLKNQINSLIIDSIDNIEKYNECSLYILLDKCISAVKNDNNEKYRNTLELLIVTISKYTNNITEWYSKWNHAINELDISLYREFIKSRITYMNIDIFNINSNNENLVYFNKNNDNNINGNNCVWLDNYLKEKNTEETKTYHLG